MEKKKTKEKEFRRRSIVTTTKPRAKRKDFITTHELPVDLSKIKTEREEK